MKQNEKQVLCFYNEDYLILNLGSPADYLLKNLVSRPAFYGILCWWHSQIVIGKKSLYIQSLYSFIDT